MRKRKIEPSTIGIMLLWLIVILILLAMNGKSKAQDEHVNTVFQVICLEALSEDHYRLHINVTSDGIEAFTFALGDVVGVTSETLPYTGHATTNIPQKFETEVGSFDDWYLDAHSEDSPYTFNLLFTDDVGIAILPVNTWDNVPPCDPEPTSEPEPTQAPVVQAVMSNGRVCTVKYPQIVLVCNG